MTINSTLISGISGYSGYVQGSLHSIQLHLEEHYGHKSYMYHNMLICEALRLVFRWGAEVDITQIPKTNVSCRLVEIGDEHMSVIAITKIINTVLVYNDNKDCPVPERKYDSVGYDLYCANDGVINPKEMAEVNTGVYFAFPPYMWGLLVNRSSTFKKRLIMPTSIIDPGFTGQMLMCVYNIGDSAYYYKKGDRLGQMIPMSDVPHISLQQVSSKEEFPNTTRGDRGFGSTGDSV